MTWAKRAFDIAAGLAIASLLALPFTVIFLLHLVLMGRPFFYASERMRSPTEPFTLWKLRSMEVCKFNSGVSGGDKAARIPRWGRFLRASRMDEVPQLWNLLRGDLRVIGPRPPLRIYVDRFPQVYDAVLGVQPGITGFATVVFQRYERRLLAACKTGPETDAVYARRCIPAKARLDRIYRSRQGVGLDLLVLLWTLMAVLQIHRRRFPRGRGGRRVEKRNHDKASPRPHALHEPARVVA
jgi:lipopolysaccharide/colanic/teichoic acid biosynthesis glycosyltransferase